MYSNGNGVNQDYLKALEYYNKAASLGSSAGKTLNIIYL